MSEYTEGVRVRLLVPLLSDDGVLLDEGSTGMVIGFTLSDRLVLDVETPEIGVHRGAVAEPWNVMRIKERR